MADTISNKDDHMTVDELIELFQGNKSMTDNYEPLKILDTLDFAIDTSDGYNSYSVGFRNGLRYAKSLIDGEEPKYESCSYVNFITRKSPKETYKKESEELNEQKMG